MYYKIYTDVRDGAWQCLLDHYIDRLPVDVLKIAKLNGIDVKKNSLINDLLPEEHAKSYFNGKKWIIIYNDLNDTATCRYAIAHELGHIFLGHATTHTKYQNIRAIGKKPRSEQHADMFAQRLLCPACVLQHLNIVSAEDIASSCRVPLSCAKLRSTRMKKLSTRNKFLTSELEVSVFNNFKEYVLEIQKANNNRESIDSATDN